MLRAIDLRTEYKVNPLGLETKVPRLSWAVISEKRCVVQCAYQIKCTSKSGCPANETCLIWDSGKVESEQSVCIGYDGEQLKSRQRVYWQVKVRDNYGEESGWSEPAFWEMGLLNKSDWEAKWIEPDIEEDTSSSTPCPYLRKEFSTKGKIKKARIYITCHGLYQLTINGQKATDQLFTPGWTSYAKRLQYQVFDVTNLLNSEKNAIGIILGDGWYRGFLTWTGKKNLYGDKTALLLQLELEYEDGKKEIVVTDDTWKATTGPILKSDIYNGETYDARLEKTGWDKSGFDDKTWKGAIVKTYDKNILVASEGSPMRITQTIKPIKKFVTPKGELVFDLGQNMVGWVKFKLKGAAGTKITLRHAEVLDKDGNFYTENLRAVKAEDQYIFKGEGIETYEPHFTFHGFRYVMVSDYN
ncbi:MAG: family 78 glycoside hydrolase catalytic domain, partial [Sedimentisphaerales bacterium]